MEYVHEDGLPIPDPATECEYAAKFELLACQSISSILNFNSRLNSDMANRDRCQVEAIRLSPQFGQHALPSKSANRSGNRLQRVFLQEVLRGLAHHPKKRGNQKKQIQP